MTPENKKHPLKRIVVVLIALGLSAPIAGIDFIQYAGLALGNDLTPIHQTLLGASALSVLAAIVLAGFYSVRGMAFFIGVSVLCLVGSLSWQPIAKEQKKEANRARIEQSNMSNIEKALTVAHCTNGDTAILYESETTQDGYDLTRLSLDIIREDKTKPSRISVGTTGLNTPDVNTISFYGASNPDVACSNTEYPGLDEMFAEVVDHYHVERQRVYPDDPLYSQETEKVSAESENGYSVDPYELDIMIMEINSDMRARLNAMEHYAIQIIDHQFDDAGGMKDVSEEFYVGNAKQLIHVRFDGKEIIEELDGDQMVTYHNGINRYKTQWQTVQQLPLRQPFYVYGDYRRRVLAWGEQVIWEDRPAKHYKYESMSRAMPKTWTYQMEYIIDDETGLVLFKKLVKNGKSEAETRRFIEYEWETFSSRVQSIKDNNL